MEEEHLKVLIVGGGLVGALSACYFAQKGYDVHLFEYRDDPRKNLASRGRSINLALSDRGRLALRQVGLEEKVLSRALPMYGRMIHSLNGTLKSIPYDPVNSQCIFSLGRKYLNEVLLNEAESKPNVVLNFNWKLTSVDLVNRKAVFKKGSGEFETVEAGLIVGADGAHSLVRQELLKRSVANFSQTYIDHCYKELSIPAHRNNEMIGKHLHIWPRGSLMMISLPNEDGSWTVTLFMPKRLFATIQNSTELLNFFNENFADALPLIGEDALIQQFFSVEPQHLMSIKCSKYHYETNAVIIGDAAHAMVPFFGQGMNAGFEDCRILDGLISDHGLSDGLRLFSEIRHPDAEAICDLALYNYIEMRDLVNKKSFIWRKKIDSILYSIVPNVWIPLYQSVTFSHINYHQCLKNKQWQDSVFIKMFYGFSSLSVIFSVFLAQFFLSK